MEEIIKGRWGTLEVLDDEFSNLFLRDIMLQKHAKMFGCNTICATEKIPYGQVREFSFAMVRDTLKIIDLLQHSFIFFFFFFFFGDTVCDQADKSKKKICCTAKTCCVASVSDVEFPQMRTFPHSFLPIDLYSYISKNLGLLWLCAWKGPNTKFPPNFGTFWCAMPL